MSSKALFTITDQKEWLIWLENYPQVIRSFAKLKKKTKLVALDDWYNTTLKAAIAERNPPYIEKEELEKLMEWKLTRGKFRPRLKELINSNSEDLIKDVSLAGFKSLDNTQVAIKELCKLRGVGPATASAVLTICSPEKYAFMADECVQAVLPGKIDYTLPYYLKFLEQIRSKSMELSKVDAMWTPHNIELAIWSQKIANQFDIEIGEKKSRKRSSTNQENEKPVSKKKIK